MGEERREERRSTHHGRLKLARVDVRDEARARVRRQDLALAQGDDERVERLRQGRR